ncbi:MAG: cardiolipin synthase [Candidatus Moranbacteria bacterium]|nr:cardiolipin synthase [Candidatus Moranbacteria bacterium]
MDWLLTSVLFVFSLVVFVYIVVSVVFIVTENRSPSSTLAWILVLYFLPIVGLFLYIFFGRNWRVRSKEKIRSIQRMEMLTKKALGNIRDKEVFRVNRMLLRDTSLRTRKMLEFLRRSGRSCTLFTTGNTVRVFQNGSEKFSTLLCDLKRADQFIHMEYFIWRSDDLTCKIRDVLVQKVKEGVEVRIVIDPMGSIMTKRSYIRDMRKAGIQVRYFFNSFAPLRFTTFNYLLHRKIVVIDGNIGYVGGMNMGEEYVDGGKDFASWRDVHIRVEGDSVHVLQATFAENWFQLTKKEDLFGEKYYPKNLVHDDGVPMQIVTSGPHVAQGATRQIFLSMSVLARERLYIQSPYFIPDDSLFDTLKFAALSGVDVRIMITGVFDKRLAYWAAFSYMEELLNAGVRIYHYNSGFFHAKTINIDGAICTVGTTNLDVRSFYVDHEVNAIIYDSRIASELEDSFYNDIAQCKEFTLKDYRMLGRFVRLRNSFIRLLSPLM